MENKTTRYIGKDCPKGHGGERYKSSWRCVRCCQLKKQAIKKAKRAAIKAAKPPKIKKIYIPSPEAIAKRKEYQRNYYAKDRVRRREKRLRRKAAEKERTPIWLSKYDKWVIREIYHLAAARSKATGIAWEVDHIIPLRGKTVSGLHVPSNLQVITKKENRDKGATI